LLTPTKITKVIIVLAISAIVLGGTALAFGLAAYNNTSYYSQTAATANLLEEVKQGNSQRGAIEELTNQHPSRNPETSYPVSSKCEGITGNLTVYLLLVTKSYYYNSAAILDSINNKTGSIQAAVCDIPYGASREGQEAYEQVVLTSENITNDLKAVGFRVGVTVVMRVIKKPAETVKFYIDPAIKKPNGSLLSIEDIAQDHSFGNGASCCGITLADGTDISGVAVIVVDEAYDKVMMEKFPSIKETAITGESIE
jgi:hypothetical protein